MLKECNKINIDTSIKSTIKENNKQMRLNSFCEQYDIPRTTLMEWIIGFNFPAYKIGGRWYVDINEFYKWRKIHHKENYKYA